MADFVTCTNRLRGQQNLAFFCNAKNTSYKGVVLCLSSKLCGWQDHIFDAQRAQSKRPLSDQNLRPVQNGPAIKTTNSSTSNELSPEARKEIEKEQQERKSQVNRDSILQRVAEMTKPYYIRPKIGTEIEWWAAYQVGQRVAHRLVEKDVIGDNRIFLIGDCTCLFSPSLLLRQTPVACHTYSPILGQGMNVSMMDAMDLAWKLVYVVHGLTPNPQALLETFSYDRRENALNLIDEDKRYYRKLLASLQGVVTPSDEYFENEMRSLASGIGIEYDVDFLVDSKTGSLPDGPVYSTQFASGVLREGLRLADAVVTHFADGVPRHTQDECPSD